MAGGVKRELSGQSSVCLSDLCGAWYCYLLGGLDPDGKPHGGGSYRRERKLHHIAAELIAAALAFTGGVLWLSAHRRAPVFVQVALGALIYTGLNSLAWGFRNDPLMSVFFGMTFIVGLIGLYWFAMGLVSKPRGTD